MSVRAVTERAGRRESADRYLITFPLDGVFDGVMDLQELGVTMLRPEPRPFRALDHLSMESTGIVLPSLGAAVVALTRGALVRVLMNAGPESSIRTVERIGHFFARPVRDAVVPSAGHVWVDDDSSTWGIKAIGAENGTGAGIRIGVLDTGFGPCKAFDGRVVAEPFDPRFTDTHDGNGHGTMCAGIAGGGATAAGRRYGVASDSTLFVAKVLTAGGVGTPEAVLAGLQWLVDRKCHVISASVGLDPATPHLKGFESIAKAALDSGTLIIAAAGDEAPGTVLAPANAVHIMAVGGIGPDAKVYSGSCPAGSGPGEHIDVAGPGVAVFAPVPDDRNGPRYAVKDGTSLATPFVAGIAALHFATGKSPIQVLRELTDTAKPLPNCPASIVGSGLVQASS